MSIKNKSPQNVEFMGFCFLYKIQIIAKKMISNSLGSDILMWFY